MDGRGRCFQSSRETAWNSAKVKGKRIQLPGSNKSQIKPNTNKYEYEYQNQHEKTVAIRNPNHWQTTAQKRTKISSLLSSPRSGKSSYKPISAHSADSVTKLQPAVKIKTVNDVSKPKLFPLKIEHIRYSGPWSHAETNPNIGKEIQAPNQKWWVQRPQKEVVELWCQL